MLICRGMFPPRCLSLLVWLLAASAFVRCDGPETLIETSNDELAVEETTELDEPGEHPES